MLPVLAGLTLSGAAAGLLAAASLLRVPTWVPGSVYAAHWRKLNAGACAAGAGSGTAAYVSFQGTWLAPTACLALAATFFVLVQTAVTDVCSRKADRWVLRAALLTAGSAGVLYAVTQRPREEVLVMAVLALFAAALFLVPSLGASDSRATLLVVLTALPVLGVEMFNTATAAAVGLTWVYMLWSVPKKDGLKAALTSKVSVPMVPLILAPFAFAEAYKVLTAW